MLWNRTTYRSAARARYSRFTGLRSREPKSVNAIYHCTTLVGGGDSNPNNRITTERQHPGYTISTRIMPSRLKAHTEECSGLDLIGAVTGDRTRNTRLKVWRFNQLIYNCFIWCICLVTIQVLWNFNPALLPS
ncbi:hypothetical protein [Pseudomonas phage PhL_UNISO_PA-DSM_ph0034]|uniref:Uncharacterized protein n=1 Tax=Pseudomonas phage PhL_UNISO_PA-DSM_ph0034 TaxID=2812900 RepID=A0A9E7IR43_9CAUD|nr:hypothetical protein QE329_gp187 [Pseudomonas phage PhL_UNISO_PA-DSM_ph0034]URM64464.1 hypothetical protein [Pseudomonas phage PhL_UNISO_PA-DSM_ph0034]